MPNVPPRFQKVPTAPPPTMAEAATPAPVEHRPSPPPTPNRPAYKTIQDTIRFSDWDVNPFKVAEDMDIQIP